MLFKHFTYYFVRVLDHVDVKIFLHLDEAQVVRGQWILGILEVKFTLNQIVDKALLLRILTEICEERR
jgi:hypothetical protein